METIEVIKPRKKFRRTISLIPTVFTVGNIFFGFYSIVSVLEGNYDQAAKLIGFAIICDMLDGRLARLTNTTSEMGLQLDSLADVMSFCLAPAILVNFWTFHEFAPFKTIGWMSCFIFLICGTMRLARFNIQAPGHKDFVGLPTPAAGGLFAALVHYMKQPETSQYGLYLMLILIYVLSFLMISTIRYPGFKNLKSARGKRGRSSLNILFLAVIVAGIYFYSEIVLIVLAGSYAALGIVLKVFSYIRHRPARSMKLAHPVGKP